MSERGERVEYGKRKRGEKLPVKIGRVTERGERGREEKEGRKNGVT